jgi:hypothetical protein
VGAGELLAWGAFAGTAVAIGLFLALPGLRDRSTDA